MDTIGGNKHHSSVVNRLEWLETSRWVVWTNWLPTTWIESEYAKYVIWFTQYDELQMMIQRSYRNHILSVFFVAYLALVVSSVFWILLILPAVGITGVVRREKQRLYEKVVAKNDAMPLVFKMHRDRHIKWITGTCITIAVLYAVAQIYKAIRDTYIARQSCSYTGVRD
jgi:hypothetical protein